MAQIIKHRRGSISNVASVTARQGELLLATGSVDTINQIEFVLIGKTEGATGAYTPTSKIYTGLTVPSISNANYGSVLDGSPFYSTNDQALYILKNNEAGGSTNMDLTGNLEGRSIDKITLQSINGSIQVTGSIEARGNISASGDITASNLYLSGDANISGNIFLGGNINIGNQNTDLIVFGGEVSSSILPELNNEFNLGAPTQNWKNLHVSGTAFINTAKIVSISMDGAQVFDDLIVSGNTFLGDRTTDSVNITGSLNVSGSQTLTGSLSQIGNYNLVGSQRIENNLTVSGSTFLGDNVTDLVNVTASLNISGSTTQTGSFLLKGTAVITDNVFISGSTYLGDNGADSVNITGSVNILGSTTQTGSIYLQGSEIIETNLTVSGSTYLGDNSSSDKVIISASILVNGTTNFNSGNVSINDDLIVSGGLVDLSNVATNIAMKDNTSSALTIAQGSDNYVTITTTDNSELITIGNSITSINEVVEDNVVNAYVVKEGSNPYITIDTTDGSEKIKLQTAGNVEVSGITTIQNSTQTTNHTDGALVVAGGVGIGKNLWVSGSTTIMGDLTILGSSSIVNISASTLNLDDNIIRLNAFAPFQRYAGIELMDSGSNNVSASLLWDSLSNYFLIASASGETGRVISTTYGTQGSEIPLAPNTLPKATGASAIGDSYLKDDGTSFSYYTDALVVTGSSGQTYIKGKVTLVHSGGTDVGTLSSEMIFRNSSNELGYISTTATTDVTTGILGYRTSDGILVFSSMIDGGGF
jgi:hypothetical protein